MRYTYDQRRVQINRLSLLINVYYALFEGDKDRTDDFADQLLTEEDLINNNNVCHAVVGGDFNVDFSTYILHTALLNSFCDNIWLSAITRHNKCTIDYSYHFNLIRFSILYHFLLSDMVCLTIYGGPCTYAKHDMSNNIRSLTIWYSAPRGF
jgi:hypothetical protein